MSETSILPGEAEHFGAMAADWWDPDGSSAMLHKLNPVRLKYLRDQVDRHGQADEHSLRPLEG
ncbi:MAG: bifunctional 2-polyprenyl-6-hydroxyphenol methylase/3-demethylubiquinol 3-O-methyltransferase UbiG, partial [Sphingomicrobium sp.]